MGVFFLIRACERRETHFISVLVQVASLRPETLLNDVRDYLKDTSHDLLFFNRVGLSMLKVKFDETAESVKVCLKAVLVFDVEVEFNHETSECLHQLCYVLLLLLCTHIFFEGIGLEFLQTRDDSIGKAKLFLNREGRDFFLLYELIGVEIVDKDVVNAQLCLVDRVLEVHQNVAKLVGCSCSHRAIKCVDGFIGDVLRYLS